MFLLRLVSNEQKSAQERNTSRTSRSTSYAEGRLAGRGSAPQFSGSEREAPDSAWNSIVEMAERAWESFVWGSPAAISFARTPPSSERVSSFEFRV